MAMTRLAKTAQIRDILIHPSETTLGYHEVIVVYEWLDQEQATFSVSIAQVPTAGLAADLASELLKNKHKYEVRININVELVVKGDHE